MADNSDEQPHKLPTPNRQSILDILFKSPIVEVYVGNEQEPYLIHEGLVQQIDVLGAMVLKVERDIPRLMIRLKTANSSAMDMFVKWLSFGSAEIDSLSKPQQWIDAAGTRGEYSMPNIRRRHCSSGNKV